MRTVCGCGWFYKQERLLGPYKSFGVNGFGRDKGEREGKDETIEVCGLLLFTQSQHAIQGNIFPQKK